MRPHNPRRRPSQPLPSSGSVSVSGLPPEQGGDGLIINDGTPRGFYARITAQPDSQQPLYGYVRVDEGLPPTFPALTVAPFESSSQRLPYSSTGSVLDARAFARTGRTDVPTDGSVVVWLEPHVAAEGYGFTYEENRTYHPVASEEACVTWYTLYLHMGGVCVYQGQILRPRQQIGFLGFHDAGSHLHLSLGDGDPIFSDSGMPLAGQTVPIDDWLGIPVLGAPVGDPPERPTHFTPSQLDFIRSRFAFPLRNNPDWVNTVSSNAHDGWEFFAVDIDVGGGGDQAEIGEPVYAAFQGQDIKTTVRWIGHLPAGIGWGVLL